MLNMLSLFLWVVLLVPTSFAYANDFNDLSCNGRLLVSRMNGPKPVIDKSIPPFSNPDFEKNCYSYARKLTRKATGHDNNLEAVEGVLETLQKVNPEGAYPHMGYAELQMKKRELNLITCSYCQLYKIYQNAESATRIKPILSESFITLGRVDLLINCLPCAELAVKKAKELGDSSPELAMLVSSIDEIHNNLSDAKNELTQTLSIPSPLLTPEIIIDIHLRLSSLYAKEKNYVVAEKEIGQAIAIDPENPIPYIARAELLLFRIGDADAATKAAIEANRVKPTIEAKRLQSFSEYLSWANEYLDGHNSKDINRIIQTSLISPEEAFVDSARYSGLSKITEAMLKALVIKNIEAQDSLGNTALITASIGNNINLAQLLVNQHANVNAQNSNGERALSFLILNGNHNAITMILKAGAEVNYIDVDGSTPLSIAVFKQDRSIVDQLLARDASMQPVLDLANKLGIVQIDKLVKILLPASI